jgi:hypothetical protein
LSGESAVAATAAKDEKSFNTSQHVELVVQVGLVTAAVAGKVTEEQSSKLRFYETSIIINRQRNNIEVCKLTGFSSATSWWFCCCFFH